MLIIPRDRLYYYFLSFIIFLFEVVNGRGGDCEVLGDLLLCYQTILLVVRGIFLLLGMSFEISLLLNYILSLCYYFSIELLLILLLLFLCHLLEFLELF